MSGPAIVCSHLNKAFGEGDARTVAVNDASFSARFGEVLYLVGPPDSGKTTLLSMMSGLLRPDSGSVTIEGTDLWALASDQVAEFRVNRIGFVSPGHHLFPRLTAAQNVAVPLILRGMDRTKAIAAAIRSLEVVGLRSRAKSPAVTLSGGEQERVAIARAIVSEPDILILDEPTAALDGDAGRNVIALVREQVLNDRRAIIIVTQDAPVLEFADVVLSMRAGQIIERQSLDQVHEALI